MSAEEMNALEKAALEDPFLSDAIEGYTGNKAQREAGADKDLEDLSNRLKVRLGEDQKQVAVPLFKWWKAAAVVILLAGTGVLVYKLLNTNQHNQTLAKNEATVPVPPPLQDTLAGNIISLNEPAAAGILERNADQLPAPAPKNTQSPGNIAAGKETVESSQMTRSARRSVKNYKPEMDQNTKDVEQESVNDQMATVSVQQTAAPSVKKVAPKSFSGKIVDENNKPVPFASVLVINSELGVSTDSNGRFDFSFSDSIATVDVSTTGYESARATLKTGLTNNEIKLQRNSDTDSKVIPTTKSRAKNTVTPAESITTTSPGTEPVTGWIEYNSYIAKNKRMRSGREDVQEEVVLSFAIDNNGRAVQIKIEKPASPVSNAEAIRLLKEGPAWKNNQQTRTTVTIRL